MLAKLLQGRPAFNEAAVVGARKSVSSHPAGRCFATATSASFEKDYYGILNIPNTATPEQIKEAYRQ